MLADRGVGLVLDEKVTPSGELVVQVMWSDSSWLQEWCRSTELKVVTWTD
jgi:hypothetical protein